jgi:hypothetical protein
MIQRRAEDGFVYRGARRRAKSTEIRDAYAEKPLFEREGSVRYLASGFWIFMKLLYAKRHNK